jgi:hypothetical protein
MFFFLAEMVVDLAEMVVDRFIFFQCTEGSVAFFFFFELEGSMAFMAGNGETAGRSVYVRCRW